MDRSNLNPIQPCYHRDDHMITKFEQGFVTLFFCSSVLLFPWTQWYFWDLTWKSIWRHPQRRPSLPSSYRNECCSRSTHEIIHTLSCGAIAICWRNESNDILNERYTTLRRYDVTTLHWRGPGLLLYVASSQSVQVRLYYLYQHHQTSQSTRQHHH